MLPNGKSETFIRFQKKVTVPRSLTTSSPPGPPGGWRGASERSTLLQDGRLTTASAGGRKKQPPQCLYPGLQTAAPPTAKGPRWSYVRRRFQGSASARDGRTPDGGSDSPPKLTTVRTSYGGSDGRSKPTTVVGPHAGPIDPPALRDYLLVRLAPPRLFSSSSAKDAVAAGSIRTIDGTP